MRVGRPRSASIVRLQLSFWFEQTEGESMATNTTEMTAGQSLREEALRPRELEREPSRTAARFSAEPPAAEEALAIRRPASAREFGPEEVRPGDSAAGQDFALAPLVDKIAYAFASGLIVAMRELEAHI